jgi:hypothetical protein
VVRFCLTQGIVLKMIVLSNRKNKTGICSKFTNVNYLCTQIAW